MPDILWDYQPEISADPEGAGTAAGIATDTRKYRA